jgi:hypothetical protein
MEIDLFDPVVVNGQTERVITARVQLPSGNWAQVQINVWITPTASAVNDREAGRLAAIDLLEQALEAMRRAGAHRPGQRQRLDESGATGGARAGHAACAASSVVCGVGGAPSVPFITDSKTKQPLPVQVTRIEELLDEQPPVVVVVVAPHQQH